MFLSSTISIETLGGVSTPIFYKGDVLPCQVRNAFSTATDNQSQVEVHLVLGENKLASDNESLGKFILDGIPPAPKGIPQIEILCEISQELELNVTATDKTSGQKKNFPAVKLNTITPPPTKDPLPPKRDNSSGENLFGSNEISELFQIMFGKGDVSKTTSKRPKGYEQQLRISMEEAYKGTTHVIQVKDIQKFVRIPAGVQTGSRIRVAGAGPGGLDLYIIISLRPHPFFTRRDLDLFMDYPISESLAYQGGELQVPVLEKGKSIIVRLPPNTKDQQVFRFANKGFPNVKEPSVFGHFYLTVDLYVPERMPQHFKKRLEDINDYMRP